MKPQENQNTFAIFPGQGSQHVGMGKDLCDNFPIAKDALEEASDAIHVDLKKLCFDGSESDLALTENTQPCLLAVSVAAFRVAQAELGYTPSVVAGHSLGEYSALVCAGAFELVTATRWVRARGLAMQSAVPAGQGAMAAILGLDDEDIKVLCEKATETSKRGRLAGEHASLTVGATVEPANFNSPGQVVIAGSADAVAEATNLVKTDPQFTAKKARAIPLQVSAPFHCSLMAPARSKMGELFAKVNSKEMPRIPAFPYVPNRTGRLTREPGAILELLIEQIDHPVLWKQSIAALIESGYVSCVEFGPGKVLCGLVKRIAQASDQATGKPVNAMSVSDSATFKSLETQMKGIS